MAPQELPVSKDDTDAEQEDTPAIKELKALDEKYCTMQKECEREIEALRTSYFNERQAPLLDERARVLADRTLPGAEAEKEYGTPACVSFWLQAFQNTELSEMIEDYDAPVLAYLRDIKRSYLDEKAQAKGFKLEFLFVENPYFFNSSLWVEFHTNYDPETHQPWKNPDCEEMRCSDIGWKPGKNVTVEKATKQAAGGKSKKGQKSKAGASEEPRDSLFRFLFRNLKVGDEPPADISLDGASPEDLDEDDAKGLVLMVLNEQFFRMGEMIAEEIIPFAVRFYTGEAGGDDDDDDDDSEDDEDDEDDDDDDEEDDSEDEPPAKGKKKAQKKAGNKGTFEPEPRTGEKQEECKQQ